MRRTIAAVTTANPHSGTYAGQINATPEDGDGAIEQVVTGLTPNTAYTLTGWVRTDGGATFLGAKQYDAAGGTADALTTSTGWTQLTDYFTTGRDRHQRRHLLLPAHRRHLRLRRHQSDSHSRKRGRSRFRDGAVGERLDCLP